MNTLGGKIGELRRQKGMTQEELAGSIGVSAQSVSKWENSTTMPDIMLLLLIADVFGISVDSLFGMNTQKTANLMFNDLPEEAFDILLQTMQRAWNNTDQDSHSVITPEAGAEESKRYLDAHPDSQTAIYSDKGGAVYANREIGLIFRKSNEKLSDLLHSEQAHRLLSALANRTVMMIMEYQLQNAGVSYTTASVASKLKLDIAEAQKAIDILLEFNFTVCNTVDTGDSKIRIYSVYGGHKMLLVYSILRLARRLADYHEDWGFRGVPDKWLC